MGRIYSKGDLKIEVDVRDGGEAVLTRLGFQKQGDQMKEATEVKRKIKGLSNEEKQNLAAILQKTLKEFRPDLSINDQSKVASTFYNGLLKQKKTEKAV